MPTRLSPLGERLIVRVKEQGQKQIGRFVRPENLNPDVDRPAQCCEIVSGRLEMPDGPVTHRVIHILGPGTVIHIARHKAYSLDVNGEAELLVVDVADVLAVEIAELEFNPEATKGIEI